MQQNLPANTQQGPASSWTYDAAAAAVARGVENSLAWYGARAVLHRKMSSAEAEALKGRLASVRKSLMPANGQIERERIGRAVAAALTGYGKGDQITVAAYTRLLSDLPAWAVEQACDDVRRGGVPGMNPDYPPPAPRIHQISDEKMREARAERDKLTLLLTAPVEVVRQATTDEERARVAVSLQGFHEKMATPYDVQLAAKHKAAREESDRKKADAEEHDRRMQYIVQGFEPPTNKHGMTMSMALARAIDLPLVKRKPAPAPEGGPL